jgi:hypothetical protein
MEDLAEYAAGCATDALPPALEVRLRDFAARFDVAVAGLAPAPLTCVIFHLALPPEAQKVEYVDVKFDQGKADYPAVLRHAFAMARGFNPDARILYITGETDEAGFVPPDVVTVRLPLAPQHLMYERAVAITACMQSGAFASDMVFLDSDAFVNQPLAPLFRLPFDVAVAYRNDPRLMKINEGVILAGRRPGLAARGFFRRYLATYAALCEDAAVTRFYGDIRRWRGGQLSLSAVAHVPGLVDESDRREIAGALVRYLPCNSCNFFIRDGETHGATVLNRKYILHLKGSKKRSVGALAQFQQGRLAQLRAEGRIAMPAAVPSVAASSAAVPPAEGYIKPFFALFNKEYNKPPFDDMARRREFAGLMQESTQILGANRPGTGAVAVDDMVVWFRNAGFLQQEDFIAAFAPFAADPTLRARIWRIYTLCWAARSCLSLDGDFMDVGCYDGRTVEVMERYCGFRGVAGKRWWLYDLFEDPPKEARKAGHGPELFDTVRRTFAPFGNFHVVKGAVPESFSQGLPERVAFAQLDLNMAVPELAALEIIHERLVPGGMIVFDDFGFRRYRDSHDLETAFFRARGEMVWESPTGQGIYIKR